MPVKPIESPEKELRFTRAGQAPVFWLLAAVCVAVSVTLLATSFYRADNPYLPRPAWALLPLLPAAWCVRTAMHLTRHAYLILTPLGLEIFPFFRPAQGMQLVAWHEIAAVDVVETSRLTLHHNAEKTSGIHLSLKPIAKPQRALLIRAIEGRCQKR